MNSYIYVTPLVFLQHPTCIYYFSQKPKHPYQATNAVHKLHRSYKPDIFRNEQNALAISAAYLAICP